MKRTRRLLLAASALGAGAAYLGYRNEIARARDSAGRGSWLVDTDMGPIEYAEAGDGAPLLMIHGAGGGFDQGLALAQEFADDGFRVIAPSRFGYLGTPVPQDASAAAQADAHAALLAKLDVPQAAVIGVSAGARSAVELAIRRPDIVAALVLVVPGTYSPTSPVRVDSSRGSKIALRVVSAGGDFAWWGLEKVAPSVLVRFMGVPPELLVSAPRSERDRVMGLVKSIEPLSLRVRGLAVDSAPDLREPSFSAISAPTLIVGARDDLFNTLPAAEFAASRIPGAKLIVYDAGGHLLVGHMRDVREEIREFLASARTR